MNTSALNIGQTHTGNICVVTLSGRIDSTNANDVMTALTRLISAGEKAILVDFASVLYLTSAAFRARSSRTRGLARRVIELAPLADKQRHVGEFNSPLQARLSSGSASLRSWGRRSPSRC